MVSYSVIKNQLRVTGKATRWRNNQSWVATTACATILLVKLRGSAAKELNKRKSYSKNVTSYLMRQRRSTIYDAIPQPWKSTILLCNLIFQKSEKYHRTTQTFLRCPDFFPNTLLISYIGGLYRWDLEVCCGRSKLISRIWGLQVR